VPRAVQYEGRFGSCSWHPDLLDWRLLVSPWPDSETRCCYSRPVRHCQREMAIPCQERQHQRPYLLPGRDLPRVRHPDPEGHLRLQGLQACGTGTEGVCCRVREAEPGIRRFVSKVLSQG